MVDVQQISDDFASAPQLKPGQVREIADAGYKGIVNARPDGEEEGQPSSAEIEEEAKRHGLLYWHIPVVPGQASEEDAKAFAAALQASDGPVLGFCRSGARARQLWQMAQQRS